MPDSYSKLNDNIIADKPESLYNHLAQSCSNETPSLRKRTREKVGGNIMLPDSAELIYNSTSQKTDTYQNDQNHMHNNNTHYDNHDYHYKTDYSKVHNLNEDQYYSLTNHNINSNKIQDNGGAGGRCCTPVDPSMIIDDGNNQMQNYSAPSIHSTTTITDMMIDTTITTNSTVSGCEDSFEVKFFISKIS